MTNKDVVERVKNAARVHLELLDPRLLLPRLYLGSAGLEVFFDHFFQDFVDVQGLEHLLSSSGLPDLDKEALINQVVPLVTEITKSEREGALQQVNELPQSRSGRKGSLKALRKKLIDPYDEAKAHSRAFWVISIHQWKPHLIEALAKALLQPSEPQAPFSDVKAKPDCNTFRKEGDFWHVVYKGEQLPPIKHSLGFEYIHRALGGATFERPLELYQTVAGGPEGSYQKDAHLQDHLTSSTGHDRTQELDSDSRQRSQGELKRRLLELSSERRRYEDNNDKAQIQILDHEMLEIQKELRRSTVERKRKKWDPPNESARKAVSKAIHRAIKLIAEKKPALGQHLESHLTPVSFPYSYLPDPPIDWTT